ncbi:MAG: sialate O-acetylesterase [Mariniblastus sp.]
MSRFSKLFFLCAFSVLTLIFLQTGNASENGSAETVSSEKVNSETAEAAGLKLPSFFSDNMVLQRDQPIAIWGWAEPRTEVSVRFHSATAITTTDDKGKWQLELSKLPARSEGASLVVTNGSRTIEIKNVLVGEVWFASGQSNMAWELKKAKNAEVEIANSNIPGVRMFLAKNTSAMEPQTDIVGKWNVSSPESSGEFSAVAYYFAKRIHKETGVPVGIIKSCWGGKRSECYTSREAMLSNTHGKTMLAKLDKIADSFDAEMVKTRNETNLAKWQVKAKAIRAHNKANPAEQKKIPRRPRQIKHPFMTEGNPTVLYNGMIHPFVGYTMKGAIWYQGEANAKPGLAVIYQEMFSLMIKDWRTRWDSNFPFYFVQLANFKKATVEPGAKSDWAIAQNQQRLTLELEGTGMATINDVGAANDIHPKDKETVGNRLALWALANQYGKKVVVSGPLFKSHTIADGKVTIEFDHVGGGLKTRDGKSLQRFEVAGADRKWHWATATIKDNTVVVNCPDVPSPVAVRYAWAANPEGANLINEEGLPASLFRTDDWVAGSE